MSRQRESFSSNRLIHEAIICCTTSYRFDLAVYRALLSWCLLLSSKSIDFSSFDPFGSGKILRLALN